MKNKNEKQGKIRVGIFLSPAIKRFLKIYAASENCKLQDVCASILVDGAERLRKKVHKNNVRSQASKEI